ncbi:peptidoglycan-binding lysin domain protein [Saprospira grandis str. Lewin]|uniref:Peptidoglycan-binding lysin domain protein n=2 Tax=Saprospira TaxID=1007 RepID=H6L517_SAPGL|nr:peptidoglycan-binding lysin domain protein [Saprospira grandis str. Lewin]
MFKKTIENCFILKKRGLACLGFLLSVFFCPQYYLPKYNPLMNQVEKLQAVLKDYESKLSSLQKLFMSDGKIDAQEQEVISEIEALMGRINQRLDKALAASSAATSSTEETKEELGREPQFEVDPNKRWSFDDFMKERSQVVVDKGSLTAAEKDYFADYAALAQKYIDEKMAKYGKGQKSPITGQALADAALKTYLKYGDIKKVVPVEMMLSQLQFETFFGSRGNREGSEKSPFNVGVYDSGDANFLDQLPDMNAGIEMYFDLMAEDYLSTKDADELEKNFTNEKDQRYASDKEYEDKVQRQSDHIESFAKKQGLDMPDEEGLEEDDQPSGKEENEETPTANSSISASVGKGGENKKADAVLVQKTLNAKNNAGLAVDGDVGPLTIKAIRNYQQKTFGWQDGLIEVGGKTAGSLFGHTSASENNDTPSAENDSTVTEDQPSDDGKTSEKEGNYQKPAWISKAEGYKGKAETAKMVKDDPFVKMLFQELGTYDEWAHKQTVKTANWCAAFVSHCLKKSGQPALSYYDGGRAKKYLDYGRKIDKPAYGAIVVFSRSGGGHVGFVAGQTDSHILTLGGNQGNKVCIKAYPKSKVQGYVVPSSWTVPEENYLD